MPTIEQLRQRLLPRFPDMEQVDDAIIRIVRKAGDRPFSVNYVDVSAQLPSTADDLDEYQDRVLGRYYFEGKKSLQWSNYLYFVIDKQIPPEAREIIESDRKYARKFVVSELELESALTPPRYQIAEGIIDASVLQTWTNLLADANLDQAVLNDETLPKRLELIEAAYGQRALQRPASRSIRPQSKLPFLTKVELQTFRDFPLQRSWDLGAVTLLCGANGSGKTSLLEAIELLYCGKNKRNPASGSPYLIKAAFSDGKTENASQHQTAATFRDRNLAWYGQSEVRTNNLYQSFSRFNFLDTDAAVGLAEAKDNFEEDLSKLLVGPEASKTWREIERTADKLTDKIKELDAIRNQVNLELASIERQLTQTPSAGQESDAVFASLTEAVARVGWTMVDGDSDSQAKHLVETLSELESLLTGVLSFFWIEPPISLSKMLEFQEKAGTQCASSERHIKELRRASETERLQVQSIKRIDQQLTDAQLLSRCIEAEVGTKLAESERLVSLLSSHRIVLAGYQPELLIEQAKNHLPVSVADFQGMATASRAAADQSFAEAKSGYTRYAELRDQSTNLLQQLRAIALRFLDTSTTTDSCPVCHTPFSDSDLRKRLQGGDGQVLDNQAAELLKTVQKREETLEQARKVEATAEWLRLTCVHLNQPTSLTVGELIRRLAEIEREVNLSDQALTRLRDELSALEANGITSSCYRELTAKVLVKGETAVSNEKQQIEAVIAALKAERQRAEESVEQQRKSIQISRSAAEDILGQMTSDEPLETRFFTLSERLAAVGGALQRIKTSSTPFPLALNASISDLLVAIASIRKLAGDFQQTIKNERQTTLNFLETTKRKDQVQKQLDGLLPRIERLNQARDVFAKIRNEHSLAGAMDEALKQNRTAIESIFARIHSPAEFSGLGPTMTTLVRKSGGANATLQQISTGQRAAFALSLFLAQNAQLKSAPPLILIDDPIAHIDDLNSLSFLDYLREIVITGERQIVFATANEKLATLFERKFDFLGDAEFRRHNLKR